MIKSIGYFAIGLFAGLTVAELMKDAKPVEKITIYDGYIVRYDYPHYYRYGYDYYYRPLEVRQYRQYTPVRSGSGGGSSGGGEGGSGTTHTGTVRKDISDRKKTWGTKY